MADRSIAVRLRLNVQDFQSGVREASNSLDSLIKASDKTATRASTALGQLQQSARLQRADWEQVGGSLLKVGTAMGLVDAAVLKTGVSYNMLQQSSRAALKTLLGSAEAASVQMDKLDTFARTSPFSKQTFISAQQQMLAFGIETKKVIPYLQAMQDAVAASGGSNQQLSEVAFVISQIGAAGKITATDLMQLGQRGIDAASLIGLSMGKTGKQIRAEITAGTLSASDALDALAAGMEKRYAGAAANVKQTLSGAFDRVKSAWRDLSSDLTEPLVGKNGGGMLVDLLNQVANVMRGVQALPGPVKIAGASLGGLATAATLGAGAFLKLGPSMLDTWTAATSLATSGVPVLSKAMGGLQGAIRGLLSPMGLVAGVGLAGMTVALAAYAKKQAEATAQVDAYKQSLDDVTGAITATTRQVAANALEQQGILKIAQEMGLALPTVVDAVLGQKSAINEVNKASQEYLATGKRVSAGAGQGAVSQNNHAVAVNTLTSAINGQNDSLNDAVDAKKREASASQDSASAADDETSSVQDLTSAIRGLLDAQKEAAGITMDVDEAQGEWAQQISDNSEAVKKLTGYTDENGNAIKGLGTAVNASKDAWNLNSEAGRLANTTMLDTSKKAWQVIDSLKAQNASESDLRASMQSSRDEFIKTATQMGMNKKAAEQLADRYGLIPSRVSTTVTAVTDDALRKIQGVVQAISGMPLHKTVTVDVLTYATTYAQTIYSASGPSGSGNALHRALGGPISGPGTGTSDDILMWASNGEHMWPTSEVSAAGGQDAMYALRAAVRRDGVDAVRRASGAPGYASGGAVPREARVTPSYYSQPNVNVQAPVVNLPAIYVTNPFTGKEVRAAVRTEAIRVGQSRNR